MNVLSKPEELTTAPENVISLPFKRILVAVDYLPFTEEILNKSISIAQIHRSQLMIFHCAQGQSQGLPELMTPSSIGIYGGVYSKDLIVLSEKLMEEAITGMQNWLKSLADRALSYDIPTEFEYRTGLPGPLICQEAQDWKADLIVMGRRGRRGLAELLLGSVSNYVLHHAHCSVLIVQH